MSCAWQEPLTLYTNSPEDLETEGDFYRMRPLYIFTVKSYTIKQIWMKYQYNNIESKNMILLLYIFTKLFYQLKISNKIKTCNVKIKLIELMTIKYTFLDNLVFLHNPIRSERN